MQVQLGVVYLSSVWTKLGGTTWNDGTAVSYALRLEDIERFAPPSSVATSELLVNLLTYGTLAAEVAIGVLVWNRAIRPCVLTLGCIDIALRVGFFSYGLLVLYLAFLPPEAVSARLTTLTRRVSARTAQSRLALAGGRGSHP